MLAHLKAELTNALGDKASVEMNPILLCNVKLIVEAWQRMGYSHQRLEMVLDFRKRVEIERIVPAI